MFQQRICLLVNSYVSKKLMEPRFFNTTGVLLLNQKWRKEKGLPMNPNARGPLTDGPDYSFLDGRLTPYGVRQRERILKQKEIVKDIIKFTGEIDFAVERHKQLQISKENKKQEILRNKLKPKGLALLAKSKKV